MKMINVPFADFENPTIDEIIHYFFYTFLSKEYKIEKRDLDTNSSSFKIESIKLAVVKMKTFNLVKEEETGDLTLLYEGYEVIKFESWFDYLIELNRVKKLQIDMVDSVIKTNKTQKIILITTLFVSFTSIIIAWLTYNKKEEIIIKNPVEIKMLETPIIDTSKIMNHKN